MNSSRSKKQSIQKLTLASMFSALSFICFFYLRIELPMGGGMTGKIYVGHAFILLSALFLGVKYGALTGAVGLSLADILAGYSASAIPTFAAKFLIGLSTAVVAHYFFHISTLTNMKKIRMACLISSISGCIVNILTEPFIRYAYKIIFLGMEPAAAKISSINCLLSMSISAVPSIILSVFLYCSMLSYVNRYYQLQF